MTINPINMLKKIIYLIVFVAFASGHQGFSQTQGILGKRFFSNWSVGVGGGPNIFFGDLKVYQFWPVSSEMNEWRFGGNFILTKQLSHVFALRGQVLYSGISGTKRFYNDGSPCNEYFDGNILEGTLNTTINFSNLLASRYNPKRSFFVYGSLGAGVSGYITTVKQLYTDQVLRESDPNGKRTPALVFTGGLGAYYSIHEKVNLGLEWSLHGLLTDGFDLTKGEFRYDAYSMLALNVTYNFNKYNPGKEPDTNANKVFVPVYIPQPITMPKQSDTVAPVVEVPVDVSVDTVIAEADTLAEPDDESLFAGKSTGMDYRVQIFAFRNDKYTAEQLRDRYRLDTEVYRDFSDGWYRFTVGSFTQYEEAKAMKKKMLAKGFRGAFITRYENGVRVSAARK